MPPMIQMSGKTFGMSAKRYTIGIDPGTVACGYAVLENELDSGGGLKLLEHGLISPQGQKHFRLFWVLEKLTALFLRHKDRRLDIAVERMFVGKNSATAIVLGEARGVVLAAAGAVKKARIFDYSPGEYKKAIAGNGHAEKYQVGLAVRLLLKIDEDLPLDVSDAAALGLFHAMRS